MKTLVISSRLLVLSLLAGLICGATHAQPQFDQPPQSRLRPDPEGNRPAPPLRRDIALPLPGLEMILTEAQRESLQRTLQAGREQNRTLQEQARTARQTLLRHALSPESTESSVREHALALAKLEAEMQVIRLRAISEVEPALTPEQVERMLALPASSALLPQRQLRRPEGEFPPQRPPRNDRPEAAPERPVRPPQP